MVLAMDVISVHHFGIVIVIGFVAVIRGVVRFILVLLAVVLVVVVVVIFM